MSEAHHLPQLSLTAKLMGFIVCPILLLFGAYETFILTEMVSANNAAGASTAVIHLLVVVVATMICAAITAYYVSQYHAMLRYQSKEVSLARKAHYQEDMLRIITDNIPNNLFIVDRDGRFWFANSETAKQTKMNADELIGKTIDRVFFPRQASLLHDRIKRANNSGAPVITIDRHDDVSGPHYMQTYHIPLPDIAEMHNAVMVTQKDITDVIVERERQDQTLRQLIDTLVAVVDRRDPYAAGHSLRVGIIAEALAREMELDESNIEACKIAGSLMNLGKVLVPRSILIKATQLNVDELRLVRKSILTSADILSLISFQAPVIPTMRQILERYDGTGVPEGRKGDNILLTARIVVVANAFVALVSPRAHRQGLSIEDAITSMRAESGTTYDPKIVDVLIHHLANNPETGQTMIKPPAELRSGITDKDFLSD